MRALLPLLLLALPTLAGDPFLPTTPGKPGSFAIVPVLTGEGPMTPGSPDNKVLLSDAAKNTTATVVIGFTELAVPFKGGIFGPDADLLLHGLNIGPTGEAMLPFTVPAEAPPGFELWTQMWVHDIGASFGFAASNTLRLTIQSPVPPTPLFTNTKYPLGSGPRRIRSADFDGDGSADFVVANELGNSLTLLLGEPTGALGSGVEVPVGVRPRALELADFNEDGMVDIAVANRLSDDVSILLGGGDGTFTPEVRYPAGLNPTDMVVHDLDGDGHLDLAFANDSGQGLAYMLTGAADGSFAPTPPIATGLLLQVAIDAADLDSDGLADLVLVSDQSNETVVFLGTGGGSFAQGATYSASAPSAIALEDLDSDGSLDLISLSSSFFAEPTNLRFGNGDGTFGPAQDLDVDGAPRWVEVRDIDADGHRDLLVTKGGLSDGGLVIYSGEGGGQFSGPTELAVGSDPRGFVVSDIDADSLLDIVLVSRESDGLSILRGKGANDFGPPSIPLGGPVRAVALGDVDGDGWTDIVAGKSSDELVVQYGDGAGGARSSELVQTLNSVPHDLALSDLNGDGFLDLVALRGTQIGGSAVIMLGLGSGTFAPAVEYPVGGSAQRLLVADFDDDGVPDLATANAAGGTVSVLPGNGDGTFTILGGQFPAGGGAHALAAADVDEDGFVDIVTANRLANTVAVLRGLGNGFFLPPVEFPTGASPESVYVADQDGDGVLDILTVDDISDTLSVLTGTGGGTFGPAVSLAVGGTSGLGVLLDFDGDGLLDLASPSSNALTMRLVLGIGTTGYCATQSLVPQTAFPAGEITDFAVGDLNSDGKADIVIARDSGVVGTHLNVSSS